jgi:pyroglutamyl-peptidase
VKFVPTVLVAGFEPFGGYTVNPSGIIARSLDGRVVSDYTVRGAVLPVVMEEAGRRIVTLIERHNPAAVVCFGQGSPRQTALRIERLATNIRDFAIPDNAGHRAADVPVVPGAPAAYLTTLPVAAIRDRVRAAGVPCRLSTTAGTFLCNEVLFMTLRYVATRTPAPLAGFIHVPLLPEQVAGQDQPGPSMALETMLKGAEGALAAIADAVPGSDRGRGPAEIVQRVTP